MRPLLNILVILLLPLYANAQVNSEYEWVDGYYKSDGTHVSGHFRTMRNHTDRDNYSTYPNINPWTGEQGTKQSTERRYSTYGPLLHEVDYQVPSYRPPQPRSQQQPERAPIYWIDAAGNKYLVP